MSSIEEAAARVLDTMDAAATAKIKKFLLMPKPTINTSFLESLAMEMGVEGGVGVLKDRKEELCMIVGTLIADREEASDPEAQAMVAMEAALNEQRLKEQANSFGAIASFKPPIKNPKPESTPAPAGGRDGSAETVAETDADAELKKIVRGVLADSDIPAIKKFLGMGTLTSTFMNKVGAAIGEDEYEIRARKPQLMEIVLDELDSYRQAKREQAAAAHGGGAALVGSLDAPQPPPPPPPPPKLVHPKDAAFSPSYTRTHSAVEVQRHSRAR